jgi:hypothetical protein
MADHQRTVDELRSFLQSADQTLTDPLKKLAAEYAEACREANARLRRCEEFLQKGLRSEAIHFAQAEPVLLDVVGVLDFPERDRWEEVSLLYGLPAPPRLLLETAEALNRAYADEAPLEDLLKKHRLLALARAPLPARLDVMRKIAALDRDNPVWAQDIAEFERKRCRDLQAYVEQSAGRADGAALAAAWQEINATPWLAPPPATLAQLAARRMLELLETAIHDALNAQDVPGLLQMRDQWNDLTRFLNLPPTDPLWRRPSRAFNWLAKQERAQAAEIEHQNALLRLEQALAEGRPRAELEQLYYAVAQSKRGVPPALEQRYQERLQTLVRAVRWREWIVVGATFSLGVLLLFALIVVALLRRGP